VKSASRCGGIDTGNIIHSGVPFSSPRKSGVATPLSKALKRDPERTMAELNELFYQVTDVIVSPTGEPKAAERVPVAGSSRT
jgi:hypothetical protein